MDNGYTKIPNSWIYREDITHSEFRLMVILASMDFGFNPKTIQGKKGKSWQSQKSLAEGMGMTDRGLRKIIDSLLGKKLIFKFPRPGKTTEFSFLPSTCSDVHPGTPVPTYPGTPVPTYPGTPVPTYPGTPVPTTPELQFRGPSLLYKKEKEEGKKEEGKKEEEKKEEEKGGAKATPSSTVPRARIVHAIELPPSLFKIPSSQERARATATATARAPSPLPLSPLDKEIDEFQEGMRAATRLGEWDKVKLFGRKVAELMEKRKENGK